MPRYARDLSETGIYHIMIRGIDRMNIFPDEDDKNRFLETLIKMNTNGEFTLYGYCIMDNHAHLLIKEDKDIIGKTMKRISVSYSYYFNHKYTRIGHLFQDRFKSEKIESDQYLLTCLRYIHKNPVEAGIVKKPKDYKWSSYRIYLGEERVSFDLIDRNYILGLFSENEKNAIKLFEKHSEEGTEGLFIDYDVDNRKVNKAATNSIKIVAEILEKFGTDINNFKTIKDKSKRDAILREIKNGSNLSIRELSSIIGVSKDIIFRA